MTKKLASARPSDAIVDRELPPFPRGWKSLVSAIFAATDADPNGLCMADSSVKQEGSDKLKYFTRKEFRERAAAVSRVLSFQLDHSPMVGVMLPPSLGCAVVNIALLMLGKVPVNLPFRSGDKIVNHCIAQCSITKVISEPVLMKLMKLKPQAKDGTDITPIVASELSQRVTTAVELWVAAALATPRFLQPVFFPGLRSHEDDIATVMFTSGSTGTPKGAVHTHKSLLSNAGAILAQFCFGQEKMLGANPAFHALGFTGGILVPLAIRDKDRSVTVVYHPNALEAKTICQLVESEKITVVLSIPSMVRMYLKHATKEGWKTVDHLIVGAEKLESALREDIRKAIGIEAEEAYGTTEFGPLVSANVDADLTVNGRTVKGNRPGSAGLPVPGTAVKIVDMTTGATMPRVPVNAETKDFGWIYVWGPQMMTGYLNQPEATASAVKNGWYMTGDYGYIDEDGFLWICGRLIIKSAGEMIPPFNIRDKIIELTGVKESQVFVIGARDEKRGERPAVVFTSLGTWTPAAVVAALKGSIPDLWIPKAADFAQVEGEALATGPTGKVDLPKLKELAAEKFPAA